MISDLRSEHRELLTLIAEGVRTLRCFQQDEAFCEDVTFSQFVILDAVDRAGGLRLKDLHAALGVAKSTTTRLIQPLIKKGLLLRRRSAEDSRAALVELTPLGREVHFKVWRCLAGFMNQIEAVIPEPNRKQIFEAVLVFLRALREVCGVECGLEAGPEVIKS